MLSILFCFVLRSFVCMFVGSRVVLFVSFLSSLVWFVFISIVLALVCFFCAKLSFRYICVVRCVSLLFARDHSTNPPGGTEIDGLPLA